MASPTTLIYVVVASYAMSFMMLQPLQYFQVKSLIPSGTESSFANLKTIMALAQLAGSLFVGVMTDRMGGKRSLLLSLGASTLSYVLTAYASSITLLYLAQLPTLFQHGVLASRAYLTCTLSPKERAVVLGRMSTAYPVGMLLGPSLGGYISQHFGLPASGLAAATLSLATLLLVWVALPESADGQLFSTSNSEENTASKVSSASHNWLHEYSELLSVPGVHWALCTKAVFSMSSTLFQFVFTLVAVKSYGLNESDMGNATTLIGASMAFANIFVIPLLKDFPENSVCFWSSVGLSLSLYALRYVGDSMSVFALCIPQAAFATIFGVIQGAMMSKLSPSHLQGSLNAVDMSLRSAASIIAPWMGTKVMEHWGNAGACLLPAALMGIVAVMQHASPQEVGKVAPPLHKSTDGVTTGRPEGKTRALS